MEKLEFRPWCGEEGVLTMELKVDIGPWRQTVEFSTVAAGPDQRRWIEI